MAAKSERVQTFVRPFNNSQPATPNITFPSALHNAQPLTIFKNNVIIKK